MSSIHAASPRGSSNVSIPVKCRIGKGIHSTVSVNKPIRLPKVFAKIMPRPGLVPSGGQAYFLYRTSYKPYRTLPMPITILPIVLELPSLLPSSGLPPTAPPE